MRLTNDDRANIRDHTVVELARKSGPPIKLTLWSVGPDYMERAEAELPSPVPKRTGFVKDRRGQLQIKDGRPVPLYDTEDPTFRRETKRIGRLQTIKMIHDALDPSEVQFTVERNGGDPAAYYEAIERELHEFGFSLGDLKTLMDGVVEVSNMRREDVDAAKADFFETAG